MGIEELRELLDAGAVEDVERSLRPVPRNADELHDLLRRAGHLLPDEADPGFTETLLRERRAIRVRVGGQEALLAVEDAGGYRDALGVVPPGGLPDVVPRARPGRSPQGCWFASRRRTGRSRPRMPQPDYALDPARVEAELLRLEADDRLVRGELRPGRQRARVV